MIIPFGRYRYRDEEDLLNDSSAIDFLCSFRVFFKTTIDKNVLEETFSVEAEKLKQMEKILFDSKLSKAMDNYQNEYKKQYKIHNLNLISIGHNPLKKRNYNKGDVISVFGRFDGYSNSGKTKFKMDNGKVVCIDYAYIVKLSFGEMCSFMGTVTWISKNSIYYICIDIKFFKRYVL